MFVCLFSSRMEMLKFPQPSGADFSIIKDLCPLRAPVCHIRPWGWCHRNSPFWSLTCKKPISLLFSKCVCVCAQSVVFDSLRPLASLVAQMVKCLLQCGRPGSIPGLQSMGSQRVEHDWATSLVHWIVAHPPGSSVHGISQPRILEWVAISSSRGSSWPRDGICISFISWQVDSLPLHHPGNPLFSIHFSLSRRQ